MLRGKWQGLAFHLFNQPRQCGYRAGLTQRVKLTPLSSSRALS
jgi:hypothetical protein